MLSQALQIRQEVLVQNSGSERARQAGSGNIALNNNKRA
jgi:hypothetical protein